MPGQFHASPALPCMAGVWCVCERAGVPRPYTLLPCLPVACFPVTCEHFGSELRINCFVLSFAVVPDGAV